MPKQQTTDELIEASRKARAEFWEAFASLCATIDNAKERIAALKREDEEARIDPEDLNKKES
jgi:hypothetical protein